MNWLGRRAGCAVAPNLIPWLEKQHYVFHSHNAAQLAVAAAAGNADEATVLALVDRGAPIGAPTAQVGSTADERPEKEAAGQRILRAAISKGRPELFRRLAKLGWLGSLGRRRAGELIAADAAGCSSALVDAAAEAGVPIDEPAPLDPQAEPSEPQGQTALAELATSYSCDGGEVDRIATTRRLLALGADPNHRDSLGRTPIYGVESLDMLNLLLSRGANAQLRDKDGRSMVFGTWTDAIVLRLLEAGASPVGRYEIDGNKTLAQQAKDRKMPKVAQWLAAHPEAFRR